MADYHQGKHNKQDKHQPIKRNFRETQSTKLYTPHKNSEFAMD